MPIPREALESIRTVCAHSYPDEPCADGMASALIVLDAFTDTKISLEIKFVSFNTREYDELEAKPNMLFVDMTPPAARAKEFVDAGAIVLDHHATARPVVELFGERGVFGEEPGVSGATLAFRYVWQRLVDVNVQADAEPFMRAFAELIGVRDTWQTKDPRWREATIAAKVLRFFAFEEWCDFNPFNGDPFRERMEMLGETLMRRDEAFVSKLIDSMWRFEGAGGERVVVLPSTVVSDAAEHPRLKETADVVVGFGYRSDGGGEPKLRLSFRSRGSYDVGELAKQLGGGGHRNAAGAALSVHGGAFGEMDPYTAIRVIFGGAR